MADLEKTIGAADNTEETTVSNGGNDFNLDFSDSLSQEATQPEISENQAEAIPTEIPLENPVEDTQTENLNSSLEEDISVNSEGESSAAQETTENFAEEPTVNESPNSSPEELSSTPNETLNTQEGTNNNVFLGNFENETNNEEIHSGIDSSTLLEHPAVLENPILDSNAKEQEEKNKLIQKEKLAHLIKAHESKAQKSGFVKGILSGVIAMIVIVFISFIFAKEQVLDLINMVNDKTSSLSANVINITDTQNDENENIDDENIINEEIEDEDIDNENENIDDENLENLEYDDNEFEEDFVNEEENKEIFEKYSYEVDEIFVSNMENNEKLAMLEELHKEILVTNPENEELIKYIEQRVEDVYYQIVQEENVEESENENISNSEDGYSITHVDSEEEANWVMPAHCNDLTCYGEDKEFTPCTTFRLSENLDENANRIGKNGVCKYKDPSELVFVEF